MSWISDNVCRICGSCSFITHSIFTHRLDNMLLSELLTECASVQISENDGLSHWMCTLCLQELRRTYKYIQLCKINNTRSSTANLKGLSSTSEFEANFDSVVKTEIEGYFELTTEIDIPIKMEMCSNEMDGTIADFYNTGFGLAEENGQNHDNSVFVSSLNLSEALGTPTLKNRQSFPSSLVDWHKIIGATKQYQCNHCSENFSTVSRLLEHKLAQFEEGKPNREQTFKMSKSTCEYKDFCKGEGLQKYFYKVKHSLKQHKFKFSGKYCTKRMTSTDLNFDWFRWGVCSESYGHLRNHRKQINSKALYKFCHNCGQRFAYKYQLSAHRNSEHRNK